MKSFIGVTDQKWFNILRSKQNLSEVNYWQPSGRNVFKTLQPGELFLFKLHSPNNFIVGGGFFAHSTLLPISIAWDSFGVSNGAESLFQMRSMIAKYRKEQVDRTSDYTIGCIILEQPFFLPENSWIPIPADWSPNIVFGKSYDLSIEPGMSIWQQLQSSLTIQAVAQQELFRYGRPTVVMPRLGQGSFRVLVTDAYERRCAITNERTLPALDAAHIKSYSESGIHSVNNGILLRKDLHALFDAGYITITPDLKIEVSSQIKEQFSNGKDYYRHHGNQIRLPSDTTNYPSGAYLSWHNSNIYRG